MSQPAKKPLDYYSPLELWQAHDALMKPRRTRLHRTTEDLWRRELAEPSWGTCDVPKYRARLAAAQVERVTVPSLFEQLASAVQSGSGDQAHGVQESKPPLDSSSLSLLISIADTARWGCRKYRIPRKYDTPAELHAVIAAMITEGNQETMDDAYRGMRSWAAQIKATISSEADRTWRMHGGACRVCNATTIPAYDAEGAETRQPALVVHSNDGTIHRIECTFCGSVLTGDALTQMVRDTLNQRARADSRETA